MTGSSQLVNAARRQMPVSRAGMLYWGVLLAGIAAALAVFHMLKAFFLDPATGSSPLPATMAAVLLGFAGLWLPAQALTPAARVIYRTTAIVFGAYAVLSVVPCPPGTDPAIAVWFAYGPWLALAAGLASWLRPSLALVTFCLAVLQKQITERVWGLPVTPTDWMPVVESSVFLLLAALMISAMSRLAEKLPPDRYRGIEQDQMLLIDALVVVVIGVHFANYFWSGVAKLVLDGGVFSWVIENRTDVLSQVAGEAGFLPLPDWLLAPERLYDLAARLVLPINVLTLVGQIACVFCFWRRRAIVAVTVLYDLQHVAIFLLTGIFFWKWIILNAALVAAAMRLPRSGIPPAVGALGLLACLGAGKVFFVAELGWYDTRSFNHAYAVAVSRDGREARVPTNYFGPLSVTLAQMDHARAAPGGFQTGSWGATMRHATMQAGMACQLDPVAPASQAVGAKRLEAFTRAWHAVAIGAADEGGRIAYDLYPHHIWSSLFAFAPFKALDKRQIVAYRWIREAVCLDGSGEHGGRRVVARSELYISVLP